MLTSSNLSLPFRFYDPNFIRTFYHPILATRSVHFAPSPVLDQSSPFIQQCRLRSQEQTLHDLHCVTTARTYDYHPIGRPRDGWMQCACVWSICLISVTYFPLRTRSTYDMVVETAQRCKPASVNTFLKPSTRTRVTVLEFVRRLVDKQRNQTESFGNWICFYPQVESWTDTNLKGLFTGCMELCPVPAAASVSARKIYPHFMETESSLQCSQQPAICPCPEPG